jgi:hypothetical protein
VLLGNGAGGSALQRSFPHRGSPAVCRVQSIAAVLAQTVAPAAGMAQLLPDGEGSSSGTAVQALPLHAPDKTLPAQASINNN